MARAATKTDLIHDHHTEYKKLNQRIAALSEPSLLTPGVNGEQNIRDTLAHLYAWQRLFFSWYGQGMAGSKPQMPAPGHTWKTTPALNHEIFLDFRDTSVVETRSLLEESHARLLTVMESHTNEELFSKKYYPWTGTTSLGAFLVSAGPSHYAWADGLIRRFLKAHPELG